MVCVSALSCLTVQCNPYCVPPCRVPVERHGLEEEARAWQERQEKERQRQRREDEKCCGCFQLANQ